MILWAAGHTVHTALQNSTRESGLIWKILLIKTRLEWNCLHRNLKEQNKTRQPGKKKERKEKKERKKSLTSKPQIPSSEYAHFKTILAGQWVWGPRSTTTLKDSTSFSKGSLQNHDFFRPQIPSQSLEVSRPVSCLWSKIDWSRLSMYCFPKDIKEDFSKHLWSWQWFGDK